MRVKIYRWCRDGGDEGGNGPDSWLIMIGWKINGLSFTTNFNVVQLRKWSSMV